MQWEKIFYFALFECCIKNVSVFLVIFDGNNTPGFRVPPAAFAATPTGILEQTLCDIDYVAHVEI